MTGLAQRTDTLKTRGFSCNANEGPYTQTARFDVEVDPVLGTLAISDTDVLTLRAHVRKPCLDYDQPVDSLSETEIQLRDGATTSLNIAVGPVLINGALTLHLCKKP